MLSLSQEHRDIVISKKVLILPGLNQSGSLYQFVKDLPGFQTTIFEFPCNLKDTHFFLETHVYEYGELVKGHLLDHDYDIIFAHSMGGLVLLDVLSDIGVSAQNYIMSPALYPRFSTVLFDILPASFWIPSLASFSWRVNHGVEVRTYRELAQLQNQVKSKIFRKGVHLDPKVHIVYDPRDELLDVEKLKVFKGACEFYTRNFPRHLCIDFILKVYESFLD
jgi:hypothetical protein